MKEKQKRQPVNYAKKAIVEAKRMKQASEELITANIMETMSPTLKKHISEMISEMDDFEDDVIDESEEIEDEENFDDNFSDEGGDDVEGEYSEEDSYEDEEIDESEDFEDDEFSGEDVEDVSTEVSDDDEEFLDEAVDDAEVEDFISQLESFLKEEDAPETDDDYEEDDDVDNIEESDDYESDEEELEEGKESSYKMKYEGLKKEFNKLYKIMNETTMDLERSRIYSNIVKSNNITEGKKLRLMKALDNAKNSRELKRVQESFTIALDDTTSSKRKPIRKSTRTSSKGKKRVSESKINSRRGSHSRSLKTNSKPSPIRESKSRRTLISNSVANDFARMAGLD